jgi:putative dimethyl sulfoxide reductase chaperone
VVAAALRLLGHFWLEEVKPADLATIAALPELAQGLSRQDAAELSELAVEYQRLFGFNLPPYESVFVDPSVMLAAPATARVQRLYRQSGWQPPATIRVGADDHLGLELLALADGLEGGQPGLAQTLHTRHLALWLPAFVLALQRLQPHPFYQFLGDLTLELVLSTLPEEPLPPGSDPFPALHLPVEAGGLLEAVEFQEEAAAYSLPLCAEEEIVGLRDLVKRLLPPCQVGLFLSREEIARLGQRLKLPPVVGERSRMLESLFKMAGQYELIPELFEQLQVILSEAEAVYQAWAVEFPAWGPYAQVWRQRLNTTYNYLEDLKQLTLHEEINCDAKL